ncbi:hypothetical protein CA54_59400 [Symmachiella macrocystis]|uniref:Uncharacterized protein n=1 Tax=Symmachiella macrocystis TaxID=2527985 RepID=A0A5C6B1G8_9PLAN|nr:hypothetical protein [Symmachiella macrocystis]TWU05252.1 hypothetical protein CA54_59400 [Symmachiella macrocystis]
MLNNIKLIGMLITMAAVTGCSTENASDQAGTARQASAEGTAYLTTTAPSSPLDIIPMRESVGRDEDVVVVGRIGGSHEPWVDGMAAFSIVDRSLAACTDIPGDKCPTPWDYCCATDKLPGSTTLVKIVDDKDQVISTDARELLGLTELQTVIVTGKASKDEAGNVTILARKVYVDPANPGQVKRGNPGETSDHAHDHDHDHGHDHDHDKAHDHGDDKDAHSEPEEAHSDTKGES